MPEVGADRLRNGVLVLLYQRLQAREAVQARCQVGETVAREGRALLVEKGLHGRSPALNPATITDAPPGRDERIP